MPSLHKFSHPKYRPDIDGLRAIAVLGVVIFHAFPTLIRGGFIGVDIFFVLSGFLISTIIFENLTKNTFSFYEFYSRRIRRIFPALIIVLVSCLIFSFFILSSEELNQFGMHIVGGATFISNFILWSESGYFDTSAETKPLLHLWSLGIEEQFYIIWPILLWIVYKRKFGFFIITLIFATISFLLNIQGIKQDPTATFYFPQTRFWELLCGSLLAWFYLFPQLRIKKNNIILGKIFKFYCAHQNVLLNIFSGLGILLFIYGFLRINQKMSFPGVWAMIPVLGTVLLIISGVNSWINKNILSNKLVVWFGLISFPLYLWHWPILSFGRLYYYPTVPVWFSLLAVATSILLAWLTVKIIEVRFRNTKENVNFKVVLLCVTLFAIGCLGFIISKINFEALGLEEPKIKRQSSEYAYGPSLNWFKGKDDWLFLGDAYDKTVEKLKLTITPSLEEINNLNKTFADIAKTGDLYNTKIVLMVGPDKPSIYPEYLPDALIPSHKKYISFFLDNLTNIKNLTTYNPTNDLIQLKEKEGLLYFMTDTHWNNKGAFFAYSGFAKLFNLPIPKVEFEHNSTHHGDLINIAGLKNFPLHIEDSWDVIWKNKSVIIEKEMSGDSTTAFGKITTVINENPLVNKYIWVAGDSFTYSLKQYFNASFKEVHYIGHWSKKLEVLADDLKNADRKPDMIIIIRVERSF